MEPQVEIRPILTMDGLRLAVASMKAALPEFDDEGGEYLIDQFREDRVAAFGAFPAEDHDADAVGLVAVSNYVNDHEIDNETFVEVIALYAANGNHSVGRALITSVGDYAVVQGAQTLRFTCAQPQEPDVKMFESMGMVPHVVTYRCVLKPLLRGGILRDAPVPKDPLHTLIDDTKLPLIVIDRATLKAMQSTRIGNMALPLMTGEHGGVRAAGNPLVQHALNDSDGNICAYVAVRLHTDHGVPVKLRIQWMYTHPDLKSDVIEQFFACVVASYGNVYMDASHFVLPDIVEQLNGAQVTIGGY